MPYGTPALDTNNPVYEILLNHATLVSAGDLICRIPSIGDLEDTDQFFQDFMDVVDAAGDFTVVYARKVTPSVQAVTAT